VPKLPFLWAISRDRHHYHAVKKGEKNCSRKGKAKKVKNRCESLPGGNKDLFREDVKLQLHSPKVVVIRIKSSRLQGGGIKNFVKEEN